MSFASRLQQLKTSLESSAENDDGLISRLQTLAWIASILGPSNSTNPNSFGIVNLSSDYYIDASEVVYKKLILVDAVLYAEEGLEAALIVVNVLIDGAFHTPSLPERLLDSDSVLGGFIYNLGVGPTVWSNVFTPNCKRVNVATGSHPIQYTRKFELDAQGLLIPPSEEAPFITIPPNSFAELVVGSNSSELWFRSGELHTIQLEIIRAPSVTPPAAPPPGGGGGR